MHFAYPARKTSNPPPFQPRRSRALRVPTFSPRDRSRIKVAALACLAFVTVLYLFSRPAKIHGYQAPRAPSGNPPVVIVTVLDQTKYNKPYLDVITENRELYAKKHGYKTFMPTIGSYDLNGSPFSWTKVFAMRHALTLFPDCTFVWYLGQDAFIMDPDVDIKESIMKSSKLEEHMIKDHPVVPPDSIIKTFHHLKGNDIDLVLTQDKEGLSSESFIIRNGEWARFFLETWYDPIYRSYNFQKAEEHALEHIVQWHPTILSRLALIPQKMLNSYSNQALGEEYEQGDFVVRFAGCIKAGLQACESDAARFTDHWRTAMGAEVPRLANT